MEIIILIIGIIGLYVAYKAYVRLKGYLKMDFSFLLGEGDIGQDTHQLFEKIINSGLSGAMQGNIGVSLNIKNTGFQPLTIEGVYFVKNAFIPKYSELLLDCTKKGYELSMQKRIDNFLQGKTFKEINYQIVTDLQKSIPEKSFIDEKDFLNIKVNSKPITLDRLEKTQLDLSKYFSDISFTHKERKFNYVIGSVYCVDSLGRIWGLDKKHSKLLLMYSTGVQDIPFLKESLEPN